MKIISISNNYGKSYDGVGDFARAQNTNFPKWVNCINYSADCTYEETKLKRFLCLGMTKIIFKVLNEYKKLEVDAVVVEYPFVEWNPHILIPLYFLSKSLKKNNKLLVLSLHEYLRVNYFRKKVINLLCKISDLVLVTNDEIKNAVCTYNSNVFIRQIPTNLYNENALRNQSTKDRNLFVYFGLVNSSKAFHEMLNAWDKFNVNKEKKLYIYSGTPMDNIEKNHKNVKYFYNRDDYEIISNMRKAVACFIPVIPYVDEKNTTFKTACLCGCICIGSFSNEFKEYPFINNMEDYGDEAFRNAFEKIQALSENDISFMESEAEKFGVRYSPKNTALVVANLISAFKEKV